MRILRIVLLVILLIVVVGVVGGVVIFNRWTQGPLPQLSGEVTISSVAASADGSTSGLSGDVEIIRDNWGIPHIYASSSHDLFFGQGYAQAQDRWWQMEFWRHIGAGRIEELTGKRTSVLGQDVFIRMIGWYRAAQRDVAEIYDAETLELLQAFADGVNAYIFSRDKSQLALQYNLLGVTGVDIEVLPWTVTDSVVWVKVMAWDLSDQLDDLRRSERVAAVGEELFADYELAWPFGEKPTVFQPEDVAVSESAAANSTDTAGIVGLDTQLAGNVSPNITFAFGGGEGIGSNSWVVSGEHTESGKPLLANDPHLGIQMPSIWYEIGLHCQPVGEDCPYDVRGYALAAFPGVVLGHNANIAWGFTNVGPDVNDLYQIKVNPDNPLQYEWDGEWRDMTIHQETINFGDGEPPLTIQVRETHLGPILTDHDIGDDGKLLGFNNETALAYRWTALEPSETLRAIFMLNRASNWEEFREGASYFNVPSQTLLYADMEGNIGLQIPGTIPVRAAGHNGLLPVDGSTSKFEWKGFVPFEDLPNVLNPERGYIATANQAIVPPEYYEGLREKLGGEFGEDSIYEFDQDWDYGYRGQRIVELLEATEQHSIASFQAMQGDNMSHSAAEIVPFLAELDLGDAKYNDVRDWLLTWDYQLNIDSQQAGLYGYFWSRLMTNLFNDQFGEDNETGGGSGDMWATFRLMDAPDNVWWDDVNTADVTETRDDIVIRSFQEAVDRISTDHSTDRAKWAWGNIHMATFVSDPLGQSGIDPIESMVNRGPVAVGGGTGTINATNWSAAEGDFSVSSLSSMRTIYDLSDLGNSINMHTPGQSSHPYSPHYGDMIDPWRLVQYHPMLWTREQVEANAANTLVLKPG
jgi:penicillin G amidase